MFSSLSWSNSELPLYEVVEKDTLMIIAFKIYGEQERWRELQALNQGLIGDGRRLKIGTKLRYVPPTKRFVWKVFGVPYVVAQGEDLGTISDRLYQTRSRWKDIWDNNRPIISDPNKIYAGQTLYYIPDVKTPKAESLP